MAFSRSFVAGNGVATRREWTPEESARFEFELCRLLATDRGAQSVYFRKLSVLKSRHGNSEGHGPGTASGTAGGAAAQTGRGLSRRGAASAEGTSSRGRVASMAPPSMNTMECHTPARQQRSGAARRARSQARLERKWQVRRGVLAWGPLGFGRVLEPRVLAVALCFVGRCMQCLRGARDGTVGTAAHMTAVGGSLGIATPSAGGLLVVGAPPSTRGAASRGPTAPTVGSGGILGAGTASAMVACASVGDATTSGGAPSACLFQDPGRLLAFAASTLPEVDAVRLQAKLARPEMGLTRVCTLRDFQARLGGGRAVSWADKVEAEEASRGVVRLRGAGGSSSSGSGSTSSSVAGRPTSKQRRGGLSRAEAKKEAAARRDGVRLPAPAGRDG